MNPLDQGIDKELEINNYWVFGLCLWPSIIKNLEFMKTDTA